jgi:hypothetical protein
MLAPDKPDWRWHVVTPLLEFSAVHAAPYIQKLDPATQKVYRFRRQFRDRAVTTLGEFVNAHEVWMNRPYQRAVLEGLLVGGATDDVIQGEMEIGKDDISAYVSMFFDIRGRKRVDIANMVFQGMPHKGFHPQDRTGSLHRLGWFGGHKLIRAILAQGLNADEEQLLCAKVCRDIVRRQLPEIGLNTGTQSQFAPDVLRLSTEWDEGTKTDDDPLSEVAGHLVQLVRGPGSSGGVSVADPSDPANLNLPAAEPPYVVPHEARP